MKKRDFDTQEVVELLYEKGIDVKPQTLTKYLTEAERQNRLLLRRVMKNAGFRPLPTEWWHFNRYSRQTARQRFPIIP